MSSTSTSSHRQENIKQFHVTARWIEALAFVTGLLYVRVFLVDGIMQAGAEAERTPLALLVILICATVGLVIGWFQEGWGGFVSLLGGACLGILTYATVNETPGLATFLYASPFIVAGLFMLLDAYYARRESVE